MVSYHPSIVSGPSEINIGYQMLDLYKVNNALP